MANRIIQIISPKEWHAEVEGVIKKRKIIDFWETLDYKGEDIIYSILVTLENSQTVLDKLQSQIDRKMIKKIVVSSTEAIVQGEETSPNENKVKEASNVERPPRLELYDELARNCILDSNYLILVFLSTVVAGLGLLYNQVTALIAAMVIAPMLQPNLALAFAVVVGDFKLLVKSIKTNLAGILLCLAVSILIGALLPRGGTLSALMVSRTNVGYTSFILALASGAAGAISLVSRYSSVLVGVMVAVALVPPLAATGILIAYHEHYEAIGAGLLFFVNIVCVNLTANLVFLLKGIHPQKWHEKRYAKKAIIWYLLFWICSLLLLCIAIYFYHRVYLFSPLVDFFKGK